VQEGIHDKFVEELAIAMKEQLKVGSGFDQDTTQGPLINQIAINKVHKLVEDSKSKGGNLVMGGKRKDILSGNFYEPTLISNVSLDMEISREEIFGPVVSIMK
jgi:acyl-CoA reductase-like NAD-dependent aldehyde dehydrogenase